MEEQLQKLQLKKVSVHNLQAVDLELNRNELVVFTGVSGSGKSSLAFDTIFVEGQRRYIESLSNWVKKQLGQMHKPDLESASGITPTISIEQKSAGKNPRSTVGTMTEVYDHLRVLYARVGVAHCPVSGEVVRPQSKERLIEEAKSFAEGRKLLILAPYAREKKGEFKEDFQELLRKGYMRVRVDGEVKSLEEEVHLDGSVSHTIELVIDRLSASEESASRIADSVSRALEEGGGMMLIVDVASGEERFYSMHAYSPGSGLSYGPLEPHDFSFNSPFGMCPRCQGLGEIREFDLDKIIDPNLSLEEDCCSLAGSYRSVRWGNIYDNLARLFDFSVKTKWKRLSETAKKIFLYGPADRRWLKMTFKHPVKGYTWTDRVQWKGVLYEAHQRLEQAKSDSYRKKLSELMREQLCPECRGSRLKPYPSAALVGGASIAQVASMTIGKALEFFRGLSWTREEAAVAEDLIREITERLSFLCEVGLHYLTLGRTAPTLSGGESQRVRLASQIGCGLVGITYVLDEPSIGLHPRDNKRLIKTLENLRDLGNSVLVVEHDEETILAADRIVDIGPGAGKQGGRILVNGDLSDLIACEESLTGQYLSGKRTLALPKKRRGVKREKIRIQGASHHNLKEIDVEIPLGLFVSVTGVSGSGKSSLITDLLYPALSNKLHGSSLPVGAHKKLSGLEKVDKVIVIDQSPIGRTPRSNPATYIKLWDAIRLLFSRLPESRAQGYGPGRFSFNVKTGSCSHCLGMGMVKIDMDFMEDQWVECELCRGRRFDQETLQAHFKGKNIYEVLEMEVDSARELFSEVPAVRRKLDTLHRVGMGYIKLGQPATTLSGGEAQRVKLAKELVRPETGKTLYILDEPTTGLHSRDVEQLFEVLHELVDHGNSVLVIEHHMEFVKTSDWVIDLGPEGGEGGGRILSEGRPEKLAQLPTATGQALKEVLERDFQKEIEASLSRKKGAKKREGIHSVRVEGASENNLKEVSVSFPRNSLTVCTGPSGSGKSSFAFDTLYAEGQRRYVESLSPYARQFVKQMPKPKVAEVKGLSPPITIEQKVHAGNPRSTVGTLTEVYDYLRVLWARLGTPHCPETNEVIRTISKEFVVKRILSYPEGEAVQILAPLSLKRGEEFSRLAAKLQRLGYLRIRLDGAFWLLDDLDKIPFDPKKKQELMLVIDRLKLSPSVEKRLAQAVSQAAEWGEQKIVVMREGEDLFFNLTFAVLSSGTSYPPITPHSFAFNAKEGMCSFCEGIGYQFGANLLGKPDLLRLTAAELIGRLWSHLFSETARDLLELFFEQEGIDPQIALEKLPEEQLRALFSGTAEAKSYDSGQGYRFRWIGINELLARSARSKKAEVRSAALSLLDEVECFSCRGARIHELARHVLLHGMAIHEFCSLPIESALAWSEGLCLTEEEQLLLDEVCFQIRTRLRFLCDIGLGYLSLNRTARSLSGGEAQRIRLARQLGSGLTGTLYVLDEPTIGLHPKDVDRLQLALSRLKELNNTLVVVEHDPQIIQEADYILDFGPKSGEQGGRITAQGSYQSILKDPRSLTGGYLSGRERVPLPKKRRASSSYLRIEGASKHNLKNLAAAFPVGSLSCVTGVSGSGKSTLVNELIYPAAKAALVQKRDESEFQGARFFGWNHFDQVVLIDQNPIAHNVRSNVGTYAELLEPLRAFFAKLPLAKIKGLQPKAFSYNHRKGMCSACWGLGYKKVDMHFLPPVKIACPDCGGLRLNPVSLEVLYKGKNFGQLLQTTVDEALELFEAHPKLVKQLETLSSVGLGYLKLGQEMGSLSGGEAQRIKLSRYLGKRRSGRMLYLMDEPTAGLHPSDIEKLLLVVHRLVDQGSTMIVIEHHLDVMKNADYLVDIGPESGALGGELLAAGTPEEVASSSRSSTGSYLRPLL